MNSLLTLLQLSDPVLPIGGFAHSYGLETYVQKEVVHDKASCEQFIVQMLSLNIRYTDAAFVSLAYDAAQQHDLEEIKKLDAKCTAVKLPREIRQASHKLGVRLLKIFGPVHENPLIDGLKEIMKEENFHGNYAVIFGVLSSVFQVGKSEALTGFYYNAAAGMVTNSVKLIPLGQQVGQEILFSLQSQIEKLVEASLVPDRDLIGLCCTGFDIASMQHERLYSRLYMS